VLLRAVDDQRDGRELDLPRVHRAVADLAHLFVTAEKRSLGLPVGPTFDGPPAA
jgi:hypothetical protein